MSAEGDKTAVLKVTKVRTKLKDDLSWLQRQNGTQLKAEEEKPWMAEVKACRLNSTFNETSPVSSPTKSAPSPTKAEPERSPASGFMIRGVFTKLDKPASPAPANSFTGTTQFTKKPSESYKKIAPHTVRSTLENQEGPLSPEEKEKRTEAASNVLRNSAARKRSYVLSAAKKFETQQDENGTPEAKSPSFVAKRVELTDDDEASRAAATPTSPVSPVDAVLQPKPAEIADASVKTAVDVTVNEPAAPKQEEAEMKKTEEEQEEVAAPEPAKEDSPAASADPFEQMKPGCTKVFTPLPELTPESVRAVIAEVEPAEVELAEVEPAEVEPAESDVPQKHDPPLLKLTPATPELLSPTLESPAPAVPVSEPSAPFTPEPSSPEAPKPPVVEPSAPSGPETSVTEPSALESPAPSVPEPPVPEASVTEASVTEPSTPESPAPSVPDPSVTEPSALSVPEPSITESPAPSVQEPSFAGPAAPEPPAPSSPESSVSEPSAPESTALSAPEPPAPEFSAPTVPEPSVPEPPAVPTLTIPESTTLVSIISEPQVPESADAASSIPEPSDLLSLTSESLEPSPSVLDSLDPVLQAPELLIPVSLSPVSTNVEPTASVVLEPSADAPEPSGPDSPAEVAPPPETPVVPVADLLAPESATPVSSDPEPLVPVSPPQVSVVTEAIVNTVPEPELEPELSPKISSSADTLTALSDTLISFDSGSDSIKSGEPALAEEEESSADAHPVDHRAELEPVPQLSNCVPMTDDLLALNDGLEASAEPVPPSPGRWSQDLLGSMDGEPSQVKVGDALDVLADDVIAIDTEARSLSTQPEEETPAAEGTQSPTETVTITTKTVIITDKGEEDSADPIQTSYVTTTITESSSADPFDPRPIGTTSPNRASDLLPPPSDTSVNSYSTEEKEPSPPETNVSSDALASLADDVIPIDTGTASLSTRRTWARTWDTGAEESQEAEAGGQDGEQKMVVMFERKSKENDSPWDRWMSPTVYTLPSEEQEGVGEEEESPEDAQQTQTVTTITTIRETWSEPEPAMDRHAADWRTALQEEQRVPTPEPEAKKSFVYVKEYVNSTEMASHNGKDPVPSWSESTASSATYSYSSPSSYSSGASSSVCTYCGELVGNDAKISIEHLNINCHTGCFKCNVCSKPMGDLLDSMFLHRGQVNCESCYAKAFD